MIGQDRTGRRQAVHYGHAQVHEHDVRAMNLELLDRLFAIRRLRDDPEIRLGCHDGAEAGSNQSVVIDREDRDRLRHDG
jgi:hypothetical protein